MANTKKTNKNTSTIKPKKPGWIRACFGLRSSHDSRFVSDNLPIKEEATCGGGRRRNLGSQILRVVKNPWCKKRDKTTSFKTGSTASKVRVVGIQKSLVLLLDDGSHGVQRPTEGHIQKEFVLAKDSSTSRNHTKSIKEDTSSQQNTKVNKPIVEEEHRKLKKVSSSAQFLAKQSSLKNVERSEKDALIGMSILIIILVIMLLCGRLCAIFCTSIWFYCMPQLNKTVTKTSNGNIEGGNSSIKSVMERNRVVFMGFLDRKRNIFC